MNSLESLNSLLNRMRTILKASGIKDHQLYVIPKEYKTKTLASAFDWLHDIYMSNEYDRVSIVWCSIPLIAWQNYDLLGIKDLTEQKLMIVTSRALIKLWKNKRPRLFINRQVEFCENCNEKAVFTYKDEYKQCGACGEITNEQITDC